MPHHTTWLTYLLEYMKDTLAHNAGWIGAGFIQSEPADWQSFEPIITAGLIALLLIVLSLAVRSKLADPDDAVVPDESLTLRTFFEAFLGYFYDLAKSVMDADRAKKYFPIIGASACFVFFSNVMAMFPGMPVATSSLSITLGCALVVFVLFNLYGIKENGVEYFKHLTGGTGWYLAWLIFIIEIISLCVRPITLAVRLMLNMAVDHLIVSIFLGLVAILIPIPAMILTIVVVVVQTLVFTLLTAIYIGLATEPMAHH